jgi:tetratricopeptide (TPR) repeat protein
MRFFDGVITASIALLFFGLPIFFTGTTLQGLAFEKQLFFYFLVLLAVVSWVLKGMIVGGIKIRRTFLDVPIALFFAMYLISALLSVDWWRSFWGGFGDPSRSVLNVLAMILSFYLILSHFQPKRFSLWLGSLVASSFVLTLWSYLVFLGVHFLPASVEKYAPVSLLGTTRAMAFFLAAIIPLIIVLMTKIPKKNLLMKSATVALGVGLLAVITLLAPLYNFVPWPAVLIGLGIYVIFILAQVVRPGENWTWLPLATLILVFFVVMFGEVNFFKVNPPIETSPSTTLSWVIAKESVKNSFFFGSGPGTFAYDFSLYRPVEYNYNIQALSQFRFAQGQGVFFEALPTIGVFGTFFLMILVLTLVSFGFYVLSHNKDYNKVYSLGMWSTLLILVVGAFLVPLNSSLVALSALIIALALSVLLWESHVEPSYWQLSMRVSPKFALVSAFILLVASAGTIFLFAFIGKAFIADILASKAITDVQKSSEDRIATDRMNRAMTLMPKESQYKVVLAQVYLSLATIEVNKPSDQRNLTNLTSYINAATDLLQTAQEASPKDIGVRESLAQVYESKIVLAGPTKELLDPLQAAYEQAMALEPNNPVFALKLGQVHESRASILKDAEQKAELQKAKDYFQQAIDKQNTFAPGYLNMALVQELQGASRDGSIDLLRKALGYDPQSADIAYHLGRMYRLRGNTDDLKQAEDIFDALLKINDKNQNVRINLGLLYEATKRKDDAIKQYQTILDSVTGNDDSANATRKQLQTLIDNVQAGKSNLVGDTKPTANPAPTIPQPTPTPELPTSATLPATEPQNQPVVPATTPLP